MNGRHHSPWPKPAPLPPLLPQPPAKHTRADRIDMVAIVAAALFVACMLAIVVVRLGEYQP